MSNRQTTDTIRRPVACDHCDWDGLEDDPALVPLAEAEQPMQRLDPGSEVPVGECPQCGGWCYLKRDERVIVTVRGGAVQEVDAPPGVSVEVHDYDIDLAHFETLLDQDAEGKKFMRLKFR